MRLLDLAGSLGVELHEGLDPGKIVLSEKVRQGCEGNKCGHYGKSYMCPPYIGTLPENTEKLAGYDRGMLLQYIRPLDVKNDREGLKRTRLEFHRKLLQLEEYLRQSGIEELWGLRGGDCPLCERCAIEDGRPCLFPDKARTSPEAIGISVIGLLEGMGLDAGFHSDKIAWAGCIFYKEPGNREQDI